MSLLSTTVVLIHACLCCYCCILLNLNASPQRQTPSLTLFPFPFRLSLIYILKGFRGKQIGRQTSVRGLPMKLDT